MALEAGPESRWRRFHRPGGGAANARVGFQQRGIMTQGEWGRKGKTGTDCERSNILVSGI